MKCSVSPNGGHYGTAAGRRTYCYAGKDRFEKRIVFGKELEDFGIGGGVDEDCQSIFGYCLE